MKMTKDPGINMTNRYSPPEDKQKFTLLCQVMIILNISIFTFR
jgi:hypothetical protein